MRQLTSLLSGSLFGLGLVISGMTDTHKVQGFLDIFGAWDPALVFVMGGAVIVMFIAWQIAGKRKSTILGGNLPSAPSSKIDVRLIIGAIMFGAGWALAGLCPGPAIASLSFGGTSGLIFLVAMLVGMLGYAQLKKS